MFPVLKTSGNKEGINLGSGLYPGLLLVHWGLYKEHFQTLGVGRAGLPQGGTELSACDHAVGGLTPDFLPCEGVWSTQG